MHSIFESSPLKILYSDCCESSYSSTDSSELIFHPFLTTLIVSFYLLGFASSCLTTQRLSGSSQSLKEEDLSLFFGFLSLSLLFFLTTGFFLLSSLLSLSSDDDFHFVGTGFHFTDDEFDEGCFLIGRGGESEEDFLELNDDESFHFYLLISAAFYFFLGFSSDSLSSSDSLFFFFCSNFLFFFFFECFSSYSYSSFF